MRERGGRRGMQGTEEFLGGGQPVGAPDEPAAGPGAEDAPPPIDAIAGKKDELPPPFARLVRRVLTVDVEDAFEKVTRGLRQGKAKAHRAEYADLVDDLDEASELHLLACQLAASAGVTVARYEADLEVLQSDMRAQAKSALNREREELKSADKKGPAPKLITDADVESRMAGTWPAEYRRLTALLAEAKATRRYIDALPDQWKARRGEIESRVRTVRKG